MSIFNKLLVPGENKGQYKSLSLIFLCQTSEMTKLKQDISVVLVAFFIIL